MNRTVGRMLLFASVFALARDANAADSWAEKLGYPAGKRVLILHANDMGGLYEFNRPGEKLLAEEVIQAASVMPPAPWFDEFAEWYRSAGAGQDVGVAITLTCPCDVYRWRPVSPAELVPSLVDADGFFWKDPAQVAANAHPAEVEREVQAQIDRARKAGIRPSHLLTFQAALLTRADLLEVYLTAAEKNRIPAVIFELTPAMEAELKKLDAAEIAAGDASLLAEIKAVLARYTMPRVDRIEWIPEADSYAAVKERFKQMVRGLSPGITGCIVSLGDRSATLELVSPRWQQRVWHTQLLQDEEIKAFLRDEGVVFTDWIEIMKRFQSQRSTADGTVEH